MIKGLLVAFAVLPSLAFSGFRQASNAPQVPAERAQRHAMFAQLNRQIFHRQDDPDSGRVPSAGKASVIRSQLRGLIASEISSVLAAPAASASDIVTAVIAVQGDLSDKPFADFFQLNGVRSLAVGYVILQGGDAIPDTQPYLEFYDQAQGVWEAKAKAPTRSDFRGCTFFVANMESGVPSESWFLVWGKTIGDTGSRLRVRLYGFDGSAVRTVWRRDGLRRTDKDRRQDREGQR